MKVIAKFAGFYGGARRRIGAEFDFDVEKFGNVPFKKNADGTLFLDKGQRVRDVSAPRELPSWLVPASEVSRKELGNARKGQEERDLAAAKAAAGPKRKEKGLAGQAEDLV